jgi:2-dehydropantoate 2-reductase
VGRSLRSRDLLRPGAAGLALEGGPPAARPARGGGSIQRVCVVGGGVIGSLYAAHLARVADVSVLCRREEHARRLKQDGLRVSGRHQFKAEVDAATDPTKLAEADLAIIATKTTELEDAAARLAGLWPEAAVMTVQNGLGAEEIVRRQGDWRLVSAVTFMSGTRHADTHVEYILDTETWLGPYGDTPYPVVEEIAGLLVGSELKARAFEDLRPAQWSKLIFNSTVNSVAALTGLPHDQHFAEEDRLEQLGHLVHALMEEGNRVAAAAGIQLHEDPWEMNVLATRRGSRHYPSMLEDVEAQRPTEIDQITGALVREAERLGVEVPLQTAMYRLVKAREASWASD